MVSTIPMKPPGSEGHFVGNLLIMNYFIIFTEAKDYFYLLSPLTDISYKTNLLAIYKHMEMYRVYLPQGESKGGLMC